MSETYVHRHHLPAVRAIAEQCSLEANKHLHIYSNPNTTFDVQTWRGECTLTPLGLAMEVPGYSFHVMMNVLVEKAGLDPNAPYEILDHKRHIRIRTNPLTHLLALWNPACPESIRNQVLHNLISVGANAAAPALFEVTPLPPPSPETGGEQQVPKYERMLSKASGQSLMAFQMAQRLKVQTPFYFIKDMIERGHARFLPADPPGLFVSGIPVRDDHADWFLDDTMEFLCPTKEELAYRRIAGGMLQPEEAARGELRRIVQGADPASGANLLQVYVMRAREYDTPTVIERLSMLHTVYGLSLHTNMPDAAALAAALTHRTAGVMQEAVKNVLDKALQRALAFVQATSYMASWPPTVLLEIESHSGLPMLDASARIQAGRVF